MKLSTWRPAITAWLNNQLVIHTWELRQPLVVGETAAFLPPLRNIKHYDGGEGEDPTPTAYGTQEIYISTRYSKDLDYAQLPLGVIEGTYSTLCQDLLKQKQGIADLLDLWLNPSEQPIQVAEPEDTGIDGYSDWIVTMVFFVILKWTPEREGDPLGQILVRNINLGLYRNLLDESGKVLDYTYKTPDVITDPSDVGLLDASGNLLI